MRTITQNANPPACLAAQPAGQDWYAFMQTPCHTLAADSLLGEQHALCCYCEGEVDRANSHVEHIVPRFRDASRTYDYRNLAISCNGGSGADRHCGHRKGGDYDAALFVSPHDPMAETLFRYRKDGHIEPADAQQPDRANYMLKLLALNCPSLTGRRNRHARQLVATLGTNPGMELLAWARTYFLNPDANGHLRQFHSLSKALLS